MVQPSNLQSDFQKQLEEWQARAKQSSAELESLRIGIEEAEKRVNTASQTEARMLKKVAASFYSFTEVPTGYIPTPDEVAASRERKAVEDEVKILWEEFDQRVFDIDLYSTIGNLIASGAVDTVEEALSHIAVPDWVSEKELNEVRNQISGLLKARDKYLYPEAYEPAPEVVPADDGYPPLVAPYNVMKTPPSSIHALTTKELLRSFESPKIPETNMTPEEWKAHLESLGWSADDIENEYKVQRDKLIAEALNRKSMIEAFRTEGPTLPEETLMDVFKMAIINPPLVVLEALNIYYEHVSMPAAGWLYGNFGGSFQDWMKNGPGIPDIKKAYNEFRVSNPGATGREAWVHAWEQWKAPGPPVIDFVLKYMLMEGLVDPTSYIGWGLASKTMRNLGPVGRALAVGNELIGEAMELPFDFVKYVARDVIPKTVTQRAAAMSKESLSILDRGFELWAGGTPLSFIKPGKMVEAGEFALEHIAKNPTADDDIALMARQLLIHEPVNRRDVTNLMARLQASGLQTLDEVALTAERILDVDEVFERVFRKEISSDEGGIQLVQLLGVGFGEGSEEASVIAGRYLSQRANNIFDRALDPFMAKTANEAMRNYGRKSLNVFTGVATSEAVQAAKKSGRYATLLFNVDSKYMAPWIQKLDNALIRPAAESYLTFGLYGPMNTFEDVWRSILGGVMPGRASVEQFDIDTVGLLIDPNLRGSGLSEMIGPLRETGDAQRANWILTLSLTPFSVPTWAATRGKITPTQFAKGTYKNMVELFGGLGIDIRRNFSLGKYHQILPERAGSLYTDLINTVPKQVPEELADAPKWVKRNILKDLRGGASSGKLNLDNTQLIDTLKARYTKDRIHRAEVDGIVMSKPDISPSARSFTMDYFDERGLMNSPENIANWKREVMDVEVDDFIKSPERATAQFTELANILEQMDVTNPQALSDLVVSLHTMSGTYGSVPDQVMGRATVKSRGLPINDRRLQFDADSDRIAKFMKDAGVDMDRVVEKMKTSAATQESDLLRNSVTRYADSVAASRRLAESDFAIEIAFRQSYFADATQKDLQKGSFWNQFYATIDNMRRQHNKKQARLNAELVKALDGINLAAANVPLSRDAVKVSSTIRLAPKDIAKLMRSRNEDISKMLLDNIIPQGDKDYFVEYVMSLVREGYDEGIDRAGVEAVYDQMCHALRVDPESSSWFRNREMEIEAMEREFHDLYNAKLFPPEQKQAVDDLIDDVARKVDELTMERPMAPEDYGIAEVRADITPEQFELEVKRLESYELNQTLTDDIGIVTARKIETPYGGVQWELTERGAKLWGSSEGAYFSDEQLARIMHHFPAWTQGEVSKFVIDTREAQRLKDYLAEISEKVVLEEPDITERLAEIARDLKSNMDVAEIWESARLTEQLSSDVRLSDIDKLSSTELYDNLILVNRFVTSTQYSPVTPPKTAEVVELLNAFIDELDEAVISARRNNLRNVVDNWYRRVHNDDLQLLGKLAAENTEYHEAIQKLLYEKYPTGYIRVYRGHGKAGRQFLEREYTNVTSQKHTAIDFSDTWQMDGKPEVLLDETLVKVEDVIAVASVDESELIIPADVLRERIDRPLKEPTVMTTPYKDYDTVRQESWNEAQKWYYKEYTDYSNGNAFDAMMKRIYPFWTYESQRWFWLPRSFVRHPGTLAAWGRWENNTDYGYFHLPGTAIDVNPARGTVYGPWSTRLMRRDYPEYYDQLEGMGGMVGFFDFISRYGFYPNVIYGAALAQFGGAQPQTGGILPSMASTPLNALIAAFPDNKVVEFISERIFPEQFRRYLTSRRMDDLGVDGSVIMAKRSEGVALTPEEEAIYSQARGDVARHSALFEQFGMFRMRSDEAYQVSEAAALFIEENYGYTRKQQKEMRMKNIKLWDEIGGLDPWETEVLQELEFFKYSGSINPVLPSQQQEILNKIELDWTDVKSYSDNMQTEILMLQEDFLTGGARGRLTPEAFLESVRELYQARRKYIDEKTKKNPLMLLENRTEYYDKYGQTMPVQSPYNELLSMYFSIELEKTVDEFGQQVWDWEKFWAHRQFIEEAIPESDRPQWDAYISRNTVPMMEVWRNVYDTYFEKYYGLWEEVKSQYGDTEEKLIDEFMYLQRNQQNLERQAEIKAYVTEGGNKLISDFQGKVSQEREALRYANPHLDAWLFYWGRTTSFKSPSGEETFKMLAKRTGRSIE